MEQQIRQALVYIAQLQQTAQGLKGLWFWGQYLWAVGRKDEAWQLLAYLLGHKNTSGLLAREINTFLAVHQVLVKPVTSSQDVDWRSWLQHDFLPTNAGLPR